MPLVNPSMIEIKDEGASQGRALAVNFVGAGVSAAVSGTTATVTIAGGSGSLSVTEIEVDFGTTPQWGRTFTITDATVTNTSKILVWPSGKEAIDRVGNDDEWDMILYSAIPGDGEFRLNAMAHPGPIVGNRGLFYTVTS